MRIHSIGLGMGALVAAVSLSSATAAFAGMPSSSFRLNGIFAIEDQNTGDDNEACFVLEGSNVEVFGSVFGTTDQCSVEITYDTDEFTKASASVLKDDSSGSAKITQQVESDIGVGISGLDCLAPLDSGASPVDCKVSSSLNGTDGPDTAEKGKISVKCDLGESFSALGVLSQAQIDEVVDAFSDRSDVKIDAGGQLTIKTKGVPNTGGTICFPI